MLIAALIVVAASCNALLAGCGGNKTSDSTSTTSSTPTTSTPATTPETTATVSTGPAATGDAATIFKQKCATCHGPSGHGDGPLSASLTPHPRNYHDKAYMATRTDEDLYNSIFNGKSAMPAWGKSGALTAAQVHEMVAFVRQLSQKP
jgi:mono/diheme cytochrome c family protein